MPSQAPRLKKIINGRLIRDHKIIDNDVLYICNGKIINPQDCFFSSGKLPNEIIDAEGLLIAPGFIDIQINGAFGVDFSEWHEEDHIKNGLDKVSKGLLKYGCTSFLPTLISSKPEIYHKVLPFIKPRKGNINQGAEILGAHLEGPFIASSQYGAHDVMNIRTAPNGFDDFVKVYGLLHSGGRKGENQNVKLITVAPDVEGVLNSIEQLIKTGITVSIGHSSATVARAEEAIKKGANCITHLFNAMQQFHHRDPGIIGLLGTNYPRPYYGIICDGIHVHPNSIKIAYDSHPRGAILVTDAMAAMGLPPGDYTLGDVPVRKSGKKVEVIENGKLAGSVITMDECVRNFKKFTGCSIIEAIEAATLHPAELLGIENVKGTLYPGADADLVFLDDDLKIVKCFVAGDEFCLNNNNN
ncbi:hypothetical protein Glove_149g37 [Diversispora epigaea]|uniref:N-acetylglucosamine-6-phosphate deacetylase n=1 Tax=Diversispora epigaea TaxID=1348612 RepID=A0A397J284_9GLOM|nr:hypothetical protein Glove_149g37 [Diversispora epigaea]